MSRTDNDINAIERDLEQTRARTESTINALQNKLQPRAVLDEATRFFQGTDSGQYAEQLTRNGLAQARENPIPMALIGAGLALLATKRPGRPQYVNDASAAYDGEYDNASTFVSAEDYQRQDEELQGLYDAEWEDTHRVIAAHETIDTTYTRLETEDDDAYQNRLYEARSRAFKIERDDDEQDSDFRKRIDERLAAAKAKRDQYQAKAGDFKRRQAARAEDLKARAGDLVGRAGDRSRAAYDSARTGTANAYSSARDGAGNLAQSGRQSVRQGARRSGEFYQDNPLMAALAAVAAGAVTGAMFDVTDKERRALGNVADDINDGVQQLNERANEKVAEYARKVQSAAEDADSRVDDVASDLGSSRTGTTGTTLS